MKKTRILNITWLLIIASYASLLIYVLISEKISTLFHPRNYPFFLTALFLLFLMLYRQCCNIFILKKRGNFNYSIFIFLIPLITSSSVFLFSRSNITSLVRSQNTIYPVSDSTPVKSDSKPTIPEEIKMTEENYFYFYNRISENLDKLTGKKIEVSGYVFREENYEKTELVVARDLMWCCAADIAVIGFYCEVENPDSFKENEWINVTGILDKHLYHNEDLDKDYYIASVKIESAEKINPPVNEYIYPFSGFLNNDTDRGSD